MKKTSKMKGIWDVSMIARGFTQKQVQYKYLLILLALFSLIFALASCSGGKSPLRVQAEIYPEPIVGQEVTLHIEMMAEGQNLPDITLTVELPEGVILVSGETTWHGVLPADNVVPIDLTIKVQEAGEWVIYVWAYSDLGNGNSFGGHKLLYVTSTLTSAIVEDETEHPYPTPPVNQIIEGGSPVPVTSSPDSKSP